MFGNITINRRELKVKDLETYEAFYCGLCRILRSEYGLKGSATLTYDMTFVGMLLSSLYEEPAGEAEGSCPVNPLKRHVRLAETDALHYAADLNVMIAYHNYADNWIDEKKIGSLNMVHLLHRKYEKLAAKYPGIHKAMKEYVHKLHLVEAENSQDMEAAANLTGELFGKLFCWKDDMWSPALYELGFCMGKFIYLMDAYADVEKDSKNGNYNPLIRLRESDEAFDDKTAEYLQLIMARGCRAFETLPILEYGEILRNILYAGVWVNFTKIRQEREKEAEEGGKETGKRKKRKR